MRGLTGGLLRGLMYDIRGGRWCDLGGFRVVSERMLGRLYVESGLIMTGFDGGMSGNSWGPGLGPEDEVSEGSRA